MSKAQEAIARARNTAKEAKADAAEMAAGAVTSYLIGSMKAAGTLNQIPQVMGLPRTVTLAVVGKVLAYNSTGNTRQIANGAANAAAHVAIYEFASGQSVSGVGGDVGAGHIRDRGRRLEAAAARALEPGGQTADEELDALEGIKPRARARAEAAHS